MLPELPAGKGQCPGVIVEPAGCILKRARTAQIMEAVLFKQPTDFGGAFGRSLGGSQPPLHFWGQVIVGASAASFPNSSGANARTVVVRALPDEVIATAN